MKIKSLKESEKEHLEKVLAKTHWDLDKTARLLRIPLRQVRAKIREYRIHGNDPGDSEST